jgi:hydroxymethylpyrimidine pyrophosphatase-like HAD family hydrolase
MWEIVPKNHSKATGIQTVADDFKSDLDHCYVFGDSFNDESMLRYVKHSIVMANGVQAMKDIAYFVTKDIEDDGIAYALEKLDLI